MYRWIVKRRFRHGNLLVYYSFNCPNCRVVLGFDVVVDDRGEPRVKWLEPTNFRKALMELEKKRLYRVRIRNLSEKNVADEVYARTKMYRFWLPMAIGRRIIGEYWEGIKPNLSVEEYKDVLLGRVPPPKPVSIYAASRYMG